MKLVAPLVLAALSASALAIVPGSLNRQDLDQGWIQLFDGATLFGWSQGEGAKWTVTKTGNIHVSGEDHPDPLRTTSPFGDFELSFVFRSEAAASPSVGVHCDTAGACGQTVPLARSNSDWQLVVIRAEGDRVTAAINSVPVQGISAGKPSPSGAIELRAGQSKTVEFASVKLRPLNLRQVSRWKQLGGQTAFFSIRRDGGVHVEGGPGQLETREEFQNFVLQFEAEIHARELLTSGERSPEIQSGIFLRGTMGNLWSGYKIPLDNRVKEKEPTKPLDFGTGGIAGKQAVRKMVSKDREPIAVTVVANGRHLATWINGYQETDWNDDSQEPKRSGTLSLQALEPATNVDFRGIQIQELKGVE